MAPSLYEAPFGGVGKFLIIVGVALAAVGALIMASPRLPFRVGRLPGGIAYSGRHGSIYFPIVTCILVSLALTLVMWIVNLLRR